jgi:DNA-binding NtrC family response regulator
MEYKILIVDDDVTTLNLIERLLSEVGYRIQKATQSKEALRKYDLFKPDLVLLDIFLDDMSGIDILSEIKVRNNETLTIMVTAYANVEIAVKAMKMGAYDFIQKPFLNEELVFSVKKALETLNLKKEIDALRKIQMENNNYTKIIGNSPEMQNILDNVVKFARTDVTILLEGECGTGKELVAEFIHYSSQRFAKPYVPINCGAIPQNLLESELFGYSKGAFTGANTTGKPGLLEKANSGTLFLDEINAMPLNSQVKMLRVLENHEYYRVGDPEIRMVDARIIAACNVDLEAEWKAERFRQDLYFRLNVVKIKIPALRDRKSDILPLANHFLAQANDRFEKKINGFTSEAKDILVSASYKGNVRELRNLIERVAILTTGEIITLNDLKNAGIEQADSYFHVRIDLNTEERKTNVVQASLQKIINKTIELAHGNKTKAAQLLGVPRGTLRHQISKQT